MAIIALHRLMTGQDASGTAPYTYDSRGNLIRIMDGDGSRVTMSYDEWNRLASTHSATGRTTFAYYSDGMKRTEQDATRTTLVWDGDDYLEGRS